MEYKKVDKPCHICIHSEQLSLATPNRQATYKCSVGLWQCPYKKQGNKFVNTDK